MVKEHWSPFNISMKANRADFLSQLILTQILKVLTLCSLEVNFLLTFKL